jgi:hypothetical protein
MTGYHVPTYQGKSARVYATYPDEMENRRAGYKPTWGLGEQWVRHMVKDAQCQEMPQTHYTNDKGAVQLGDKAIADTQRAEEDAEGGLVALALRGYGYRNG